MTAEMSGADRLGRHLIDGHAEQHIGAGGPLGATPVKYVADAAA